MILFQCVLRSIHKTVTEFSASKIHFQGGNFDQFFDCLKKVLILVIIHFKMRIWRRLVIKPMACHFLKGDICGFCGLGNSEYNLTYVYSFLHDVEKH